MASQQITVQTTINSPIERVWGAYTTPADITRWNFASDDWCCPSAEADLRVGGTYKARMEPKDRSLGFDFVAIYEELQPNRVLTLAMAERTTFALEDGKMEATTTLNRPGFTGGSKLSRDGAYGTRQQSEPVFTSDPRTRGSNGSGELGQS